MELRLRVEGANSDELKRGVDAAIEVFKRHNVHPLDAASGMFALEGWDDAGFPDEGDMAFSEEDGRRADIWLEATEAAVKACCATWPEPQPAYTTSLELEMSEAEKLAMDGPEDIADDDTLILPPDLLDEYNALRAKFRSENPPEVEFAAQTPLAITLAPRNGRWFVGRDQGGNIAHVFWRDGTALEIGEVPGWSRFSDEMPFDLVDWVPTAWEYNDMIKAYD